MDQPKRRLKVNMMDLEEAFASSDDLLEMLHFLDLETGEVVMTTREDRSLLEDVYEQYSDPETGQVDWPTVLPQLGIPDWQQDALMAADKVEAGYLSRYIAIPHENSTEGYNDMVAFIETVSNPRLQERLERSVHGKGAFRHFKDVLLDDPKERERWFAFSQERLHQRIRDWLATEEIELIEP